MIMMRLSTTSLSFLINGVATKQLKWGDPLSSYLFSLIIQNFTSLIEENINNRQVTILKKHGVKGVSQWHM